MSSKSWPLIFILWTMVSCAHRAPEEGSTYYLGGYDENNQAPGAAYTVDGFHIAKPMAHRASEPKHPYFYKVCHLADTKPHLSRRDYACSDLPWVSGPMGY